MSLTDQPVLNNSVKKEHRRVPIPSSRLYETGPPLPRMARLTVSLPGGLVDRLRDTVYWSPGLKLAWLIAQSLTDFADRDSIFCVKALSHNERMRYAQGNLEWLLRQ